MVEQCKCGSLDFFIQKQGNNTGLYCSMCGRWQKWLNKNETRLFEQNHKPKLRNVKKHTNDGRINSMSAEEKAEWLYNHDTITAEKGRLSKEELLQWLKSEAKEET